MFPILFPVYLTFSFSMTVVKCDFMSINWTKSTVRGNSHLEREYKYPMYENVAPSSCDLTDSCDVFCCRDPDCNDTQKQSFQCFESPNHALFSFDCNSDYYDKPEWMTWLCYVFINPVYLGKFYSTPRKIEKIAMLKSKINNKVKNFGDRRASKPKPVLQYGSPIMTYSPMINSFPSVSPLMVKAPIQDSSSACVLTPVKYRQSGVTTCLQGITPDLCENTQSLGITPYLIQNTMFKNINAPIVLKSPDFLEGIQTEVEIKCIKPKLHTKKFRKVKLHIFQQDSVCDDSVDTFRTAWKKPVCENVLAYVHHHFTVNGSDLVKLNVEYGVMNISLPSDVLDEFSGSFFHQYIYTKQVFNITFHDILNSTYTGNNSSESLFSRGYFLGEELNFGYKSFENSTEVWRKGFIGIFNNGRSCEKSSPITFGFDSISTCEISAKFSNCTQLRNKIREKFDSLLRGEKMAVNGDLRAPYNATVPLLRNYPNSPSELSTNSSSLCSVPLIQDLLIQYTTVFTENGIPIHRVMGVRVDRSYKNVSPTGALTLTSRVLYYFVSSSTDKPLSRFWTRMYSPELSENSWLNIFKAFDDVSTDEREEITFWCIFLIISVSIFIACTGMDVNLVLEKKREIEGKNMTVINLPCGVLYENIWRQLLAHPLACRYCCCCKGCCRCKGHDRADGEN